MCVHLHILLHNSLHNLIVFGYELVYIFSVEINVFTPSDKCYSAVILGDYTECSFYSLLRSEEETD